MENETNSAQILEQIAGKKIVVYGAGHVARKFLKALKLYHYDKNILCFIVSKSGQNEKTIEGIPVKTVDWLAGNKNIPIYVAVHQSLWHEIAETLRTIGISNYIWIYPYLYEMLLGLPIKTNIKVDLKDIIQTCTDDYRLAIRYAAIEQYFGRNEVGFELYIRAQALQSSPETAKERLIEFCKLIKKWQESGYDAKNRIFINQNYEIIDGVHRVALSRYCSQHQVVCDMFRTDIGAIELHGENVMLTDRILSLAGFSDEEMKYLDAVNQVIKDGK